MSRTQLPSFLQNTRHMPDGASTAHLAQGIGAEDVQPNREKVPARAPTAPLAPQGANRIVERQRWTTDLTDVLWMSLRLAEKRVKPEHNAACKFLQRFFMRAGDSLLQAWQANQAQLPSNVGWAEALQFSDRIQERADIPQSLKDAANKYTETYFECIEPVWCQHGHIAFDTFHVILPA